ncbi:hypothetical protein F4859DRAFT_517719 [Xylaria cf. heliscus]|nr:hypothetical protein F4859DRAFT_517719 [Xylaria cf. heliscus]
MSRSPRFSYLRQLVFDGDGLTPEEARYLKILLSKAHTDLINELPLEIVTLIALELQLKDFVSCISVSKIWRRRLLSDSIMSAYARHRWPAMVEDVVSRSGFLETLLKLKWVHSSLPDPYFREWGSKDECALDPVFHSQSANVPDIYMQYSAGKLRQACSDPYYHLHASSKAAYHLYGCVILVDDRRSNLRKVLTPPSGMMYGSKLDLKALGSRLVIGAINRLLVAWDHVDNKAYEKSLPCRILRCATQDNRVAAVLYGGDVVIWSPGHAAIQLDPSPLTLVPGINPSQARSWKAHLDVFFDPRNSKNLYLASAHHIGTGPKAMIRVTVHEFSEAVHVASWSSDHREPAMDFLGKDFLGNDRPYPEENTGNQYITISDYEVDYSCISFHWWPSKSTGRLPAFDKMKRKFVDSVNFSQGCLFDSIKGFDNRAVFFREDFTLRTGINLDHIVGFAPEGSEATQLKLPQNTRDKESCQDLVHETM